MDQLEELGGGSSALSLIALTPRRVPRWGPFREASSRSSKALRGIFGSGDLAVPFANLAGLLRLCFLLREAPDEAHTCTLGVLVYA